MVTPIMMMDAVAAVKKSRAGRVPHQLVCSLLAEMSAETVSLPVERRAMMATQPVTTGARLCAQQSAATPAPE